MDADQAISLTRPSLVHLSSGDDIVAIAASLQTGHAEMVIQATVREAQAHKPPAYSFNLFCWSMTVDAKDNRFPLSGQSSYLHYIPNYHGDAIVAEKLSLEREVTYTIRVPLDYSGEGITLDDGFTPVHQSWHLGREGAYILRLHYKYWDSAGKTHELIVPITLTT